MAANRTLSGLFMAGTAFILWGLLPIYWKSLQSVPTLELLCHRIVWAVPFTALILTFQGRWRETFGAIREKRTVLLLLVSSTLVGLNWFIYVWAVNTGHIVETSLGYFITPLLNVLLGVLFFRDKLRPLQLLAIALAFCGVCYSIIGFGSLPWISLVLAFSFGLYGLTRKLVHIEALPGLFYEALLLGLPALAWLISLGISDQGTLFTVSTNIDLLLVGAGVATSIPLVAFAGGARRLTLPTLGTLQYIAPSCAFLLGVFVYNEPFNLDRLIAFAFIWAGVIVYVLEGIHSFRNIPGVKACQR